MLPRTKNRINQKRRQRTFEGVELSHVNKFLSITTLHLFFYWIKQLSMQTIFYKIGPNEG